MNASPLGMDLGEFMLDGDFEFLNHLAGVGGVQGTSRLNNVNMATGMTIRDNTGVP